MRSRGHAASGGINRSRTVIRISARYWITAWRESQLWRRLFHDRDLAADVVNGIRATGRGYNARVEKVLREAISKGLL